MLLDTNVLSECMRPRPAMQVLAWLDAPERITALQHRFTALHTELRRDTAALATDAIQKVLES